MVLSFLTGLVIGVVIGGGIVWENGKSMIREGERKMEKAKEYDEDMDALVRQAQIMDEQMYLDDEENRYFKCRECNRHFW